MVSNIDPTFPTAGIDQPSQGFRDNFNNAKIEIEALQVDVAAGLQNIVEDLTPQLGANLDNNSFSITTDGNVVLSFASGGETAVNWIDIVHATTGSGPTIRSVGSDTNIDLNISAKGAGIVNLGSGGVKLNAPLDANGQSITNVSSFVEGNGIALTLSSGNEEGANWVDVVWAESGQSPIIRSVGADSNIDLNISAKGTGIVNLGSGGVKLNAPLDVNNQTFNDVSSFSVNGDVIISFTEGGEFAVNWIDVNNTNTGFGPVIRSVGADTNVDLVFDTKGTGDIDVSSNKIVNLTNPGSSQDAATKDYVDTEISGIGAPVSAFRLDAGPATAIISGDGVVVLSSGAPAQAATLPLAAGVPPGTTFTLKNGAGTSAAVIVPSGGDTIDFVGGPNAVLLVAPVAFTRLIGDGGANWYVA